METLRHRLDDQLRLKADMLVEQDELKGVKEELPLLREEAKNDQESIELQALSLQQFIAAKFTPSWSGLHTAIEEDERALTNESPSMLNLVVSGA